MIHFYNELTPYKYVIAVTSTWLSYESVDTDGFILKVTE